jgi:site-specific DNA recombinase
MKAAIYARYSTDKQSESSIDDQLRECRKLAKRHEFNVVAKFSDKALSGGTANRPDYQNMLVAARSGQFDVIVAEDTSRLWRNMAEQAVRLAEFQDLGVKVVTYDLDTRQESAGILGAVNGAMSEHYRREIGRRTRRGLEGLAQSKKPTGGRSYGYIAATDSSSDEREIDPEQALVVVRIFQMYADGMSPRAIAEQLNVEQVPSPGSHWNRKTRRNSGWAMSGIAGDPKRGTGILNNELYIGRVIWGRSRWRRSARDSSKRTCQQNPREQWTIYEEERLRIIEQTLWDRVRNRQQAQSERIGERVSAGLSKASAKSTGRSPRYLFSSLLKCGVCGSSYTIRGRTHYACGRHLDGRACSQTKGVKRAVVEPGLLQGIRAELLSDEAIQTAIKAAHRVLAAQKPADDSKRIVKLKAEIENLADAIASGALKSSPALASRLAKAEKELATLEAKEPAPKAAQMIPKLADEYRAWVSELETILSPDGLKHGLVSDRDIARARAQLKKRLGGNIIVTEASDEIRFETEASTGEMALRMTGNGHAQVFMVAGAGFEPTTFGL